jgi:hypothetical protein
MTKSIRFLFIILAILAIHSKAMCEDKAVVCDRLYYDGEEGNLALNIGGKFKSLEALSETMNLHKEIGRLNGKGYRLHDILVKADFNGGGFCADWQVSGPKPVIEAYAKTLEKGYGDKSVFYDFSYAKVDLKPTAFYETEDAFSISLSFSKHTYKPGEDIIAQARINNNMKTPALLVKCADGSVRGWRYPQCVFEIKDASGKTPENIYAPMCKTVNPLTPEEFITVPPKKSAELFDGGFVFSRAFNLTKPGKYFIFVRYSTVAVKEWQWYGLYSDEYWKDRNQNEFWKKRSSEILKNRKMLDKIELFSIKSNTVEIEIAAKTVDRATALKIAEDACRISGWKFKDATAEEKPDSWIIRTNTHALGMNAMIKIDKYTGKVKEKNITGP